MPGYTKTSQSVRQNYELAKATLMRAGIDANATKLTQHTLRVEALLTTTATSYQFAVLVNQSSPGASGSSFNTENKLNLQDACFIHEVGLYIAKPSSATDSSFRLFSYPDAGTFSTASVATQAYGIYNGNLSLSVDNNQIVPFWDCQRHLNIPNPNYSAPATASTGQINMISAQDGTTQGLSPVEPMWILNGTQNIALKLNLPVALSAVESTQRIVLLLKGHLAQNVGINLKQFSQI